MQWVGTFFHWTSLPQYRWVGGLTCGGKVRRLWWIGWEKDWSHWQCPWGCSPRSATWTGLLLAPGLPRSSVKSSRRRWWTSKVTTPTTREPSSSSLRGRRTPSPPFWLLGPTKPCSTSSSASSTTRSTSLTNRRPS